jgi:hypothetical protein
MPYIKFIIKIQALHRGHRARQKVKFIKGTKRTDNRYFTAEEQRETLRNVAYDPNGVRETRSEFKFKSGATYTGEWIGGFRDGFGS